MLNWVENPVLPGVTLHSVSVDFTFLFLFTL